MIFQKYARDSKHINCLQGYNDRFLNYQGFQPVCLWSVYKGLSDYICRISYLYQDWILKIMVSILVIFNLAINHCFNGLKLKWPEVIISSFNTLRSWQNRHHFADDMCKWIFLNENLLISLKISLKFAPKVRINNIPAWVQVMAWHTGTDQATGHYLNQWWLVYWCIYVSLDLNELTHWGCAWCIYESVNHSIIGWDDG